MFHTVSILPEDNGIWWHHGMSSDVFFAAIIPLNLVVESKSPFKRTFLFAFEKADFKNIFPDAIASRDVIFLAETSTMLTWLLLSRCVNFDMVDLIFMGNYKKKKLNY